MKIVEFNDDEDAEFRMMISNQFFKGYDEADSIYDKENSLTKPTSNQNPINSDLDNLTANI